MGKWISVKEKLPPTHTLLLLCRELRVEGLDHPFFCHEIGMIEGTNPSDRWRLESQQYCALPCTPTLDSGIITHWQRLPKLPDNK